MAASAIPLSDNVTGLNFLDFNNPVNQHNAQKDPDESLPSRLYSASWRSRAEDRQRANTNAVELGEREPLAVVTDCTSMTPCLRRLAQGTCASVY